MTLPLASFALVIAAHSAAGPSLCGESALPGLSQKRDGGALCEREAPGPRIRVPPEHLVFEPLMDPAPPSDALFGHLPLLSTEGADNDKPSQARTQAQPFLFHAFAYLFMDGRGAVAFRVDAEDTSEERDALGGPVAEQLHRSLLVHAGISF